jgi:hypothetical protein
LVSGTIIIILVHVITISQSLTNIQARQVFSQGSSFLSLVVDSFGHPDFQAVEFLGHADLAAESARIYETVGKVQHVELFISGLVWEEGKILRLEDEVAGGAGEGALARAKAVNVDVVVDDDVEQVLADLAFDRGCLSVRRREGHGHKLFCGGGRQRSL